MNIFRPPLFRTLAAAAALAAAALSSGCDVDSTSGSTSGGSGESYSIFNFSGLYMSISNGNALVFPANRQTGTQLTWLRLLHYGSVLEGYDNASQTWSGEITSVQETTASFSLQGRTSAGASVDIAGTLTYDETDTLGTMNAAWIEPSFSGSIFAEATVAAATSSTNSPDPTNGVSLSVSPTSATLSSTNKTMTFAATGGSGTYTWTHNSDCGTFLPSTGSSTLYTWSKTGNDTLTVTSGDESKSASITCK